MQKYTVFELNPACFALDKDLLIRMGYIELSSCPQIPAFKKVHSHSINLGMIIFHEKNGFNVSSSKIFESFSNLYLYRK